jgi:predicted regulator of Ras-like GTPase activity (Roadblock/LC7/MglB family)
MGYWKLERKEIIPWQFGQDLVEKLRNFYLHKETKNVVVLMRIDKDKCLVLLDKEYENISHMNLKMNYLSNHLFYCV